MKSFRTATNEIVPLTTKVSEVKDELSITNAGMVVSCKIEENSFCWDLTEKAAKTTKIRPGLQKSPLKHTLP